MNGNFSQAENRVREMNNITRSYLERSNRSFQKPPAVVSVPRFEPVPTQTVHKEAEICHDDQQNESCTRNMPCRSCSNPLDKLFKGADGEKNLILLLILLLINEKADIKVIIALIYLIL
ncbi:MAG: hypothetical protein IJ007_01705 [Oscillospiraceae bacterium]|nr:hypothetical protein [Oscillospiraceae bacterium]